MKPTGVATEKQHILQVSIVPGGHGIVATEIRRPCHAGLVWPVVFASCVIAACVPRAAPEKLDDPDPKIGTLRPSDHRLIAAPRFELDVASIVPDPSHHLRWPLSHNTHPKLEPGYDIAAALAQPGVTWIELCNMGAHKRRLSSGNQDPIAYLAAWCNVLFHDVDAAVGGLAPLQRSTIAAIARAIRIDLANILVSESDADRAELVLARHKIDQPELLDILAATFAELGKLDDALVLNARALESHAGTMTRCHRLARHVALGKLDALEKLDKIWDPDCRALTAELRCANNPARDCGLYFVSVNVDRRMANMLAAYYAWPIEPAGPEVWLRVAHHAHDAIPMPNADTIAAVALENAMRASACDSEWVKAALDVASQIRQTLHANQIATAKIEAVYKKPCWKP